MLAPFCCRKPLTDSVCFPAVSIPRRNKWRRYPGIASSKLCLFVVSAFVGNNPRYQPSIRVVDTKPRTPIGQHWCAAGCVDRSLLPGAESKRSSIKFHSEASIIRQQNTSPHIPCLPCKFRRQTKPTQHLAEWYRKRGCYQHLKLKCRRTSVLMVVAAKTMLCCYCCCLLPVPARGCFGCTTS